MTPYYADEWLTVLQGDCCRERLAELPDESVHCVVTSPPYWGLRDYGTATWEGGDVECAHRPSDEALERGFGRASTLAGTTTSQKQAATARHSCKCGAVRIDSQLGLEPTPELYVEHMVAVFREVRRVLRKDGTLWLNLGDSYASSPPGNLDYAAGLAGAKSPKYQATLTAGHATKRNTIVGSLKPKDLVGIPWRVAFALQADGWYLRSDIIWAKPNPMPESVTDRPTKSHEYLFLLSKSARYYYDAEAVREPLTDSPLLRLSQPTFDQQTGGPKDYGPESGRSARKALVNLRSRNIGGRTDGFTRMPGGEAEWSENGRPGRNLRSVWTIATQPYPGAHFATFPPKLVEPCIKAGCPEGGVVLDPFAGSGTTGMVAQALSRKAILIDLNGDYLLQAMLRNRDIPLGLVG